MDIQLYDSFVGQQALFGHLALNLVQEHRATVELQIAHLNRVRMRLRIHGEADAPLMARIAQAEAMLPWGYRWRRVEPDTMLDARGLRMARIVRRLEFVDLPVASPDLPGNSGSLAQMLGLPARDDELRQLPTLETIGEDLLEQRFCVPLPGALEAVRPRARALFQEILREAPAIISICLHPLDPNERWNNQRMALAWKRFVDPFANVLASAGFADAKMLRSAYDRYSLPPGHLIHASIRVAGEANRAVIGVANTLVSALGGFRAFQVLPPTREVPGAALYATSADTPARWSERMLIAQRELMREQLAGAGVAIPADSTVLDFLMRSPHLFTIEEAGQLLRLPVADEEGLPGFTTEPVPPFVVPSLAFLPVAAGNGAPAPAPAGRFRVGMVRKPGSALEETGDGFTRYDWHAIDLADLTKHALIVGSTGSGKTMTTLFVARELTRLAVPVMVIEPVKTEYYRRLRKKIPGLRRLRLEANADGKAARDFLAFDPLRVPTGISVMRHASYLKSCFEAAFPMSPVLSLVLENALVEYYTGRDKGACGYAKFARGGPGLGRVEDNKVYPSFATFRDFVLGPFLDKAFSARSAQADEFRDIFRRRFVNLGESILGTSFRIADATYISSARSNGGIPRERDYDLFAEGFLDRPVVIELDGIPDADQKALAMAFLMTYLFERRQAEDLLARERDSELPGGLRHFLIVEEAHRLLAAGASAGGRGEDTVGQSSQQKAVGLFIDMLAEIRAFGQGLAIVEQIPTKIVSEAVKNTNLKIMLRLTAADDRDYLGSAMNFTEAQKRFVTSLKVEKPRTEENVRGQVNFVMFEEGVDQPMLLSLPLGEEPGSDWLYDEFFQPG